MGLAVCNNDDCSSNNTRQEHDVNSKQGIEHDNNSNNDTSCDNKAATRLREGDGGSELVQDAEVCYSALPCSVAGSTGGVTLGGALVKQNSCFI